MVEDKREQQFRQLGMTIAYHRKMCGMTQMQFAEAINVSRTHLSNIEAPNMHTSVSLDLLFDISEALGISVAKLFAPID